MLHRFGASAVIAFPTVAVQSLSTLIISTALAQAIPEAGSLASQFERITLVSALSIAVIVLWRAREKTSEQLLEAQKALATAITANVDAQKELRGAVSELKDAIGTMPCSGLPADEVARLHGRR